MPMPIRFQFRHCWLALFSVCLLAGTVSALAHGDVHERIEVLTRALDEHPDRGELWLQRADLRRQHSELSAALADANEALRLRPNWPAALLQRARILLEQREYAAAKAAADACLDLSPENPDARVVLARCHAGLGDTNAAIQDLSVVLSGEQRPLPDLYLERARWQAGLGEFKAAVQGLDEGMERLGRTPSLALPALDFVRQEGDIESALDRLETVQRFVPHERYIAIKAELLVQMRCHDPAAGDSAGAPMPIANAAPASPRSTPGQPEQLRTRLAAETRKSAEPNTTHK